VTDLVTDFTFRLLAAIEQTTVDHGEALIASAFSRIAVREGKALRRAVNAQTRQFLRAVESVLRARVRKALAEARRQQAREQAQAASLRDAGAAPVRRRPRRQPVRPLPPPRDPEQIKRDAEFARLRALLRPANEEAPAPVPAPAPPVVEPARPATPGDFLRALEKEIQNAVPTLGALGPERCGARIAVWAGQVRELRDRLPADVSAAMRPAFRIFLEHLTELRDAMEAPVVDALEPKWSAPDWSIYIEVNRALVEERPPALAGVDLEIHYHAMLRALVLPHRRNHPSHAIPIIDAAARILPASDSLLRSAIRRHTPQAQEPAETAEAAETAAEDPASASEEPPVEAIDAEPTPASIEAIAAEPTPASTDEVPAVPPAEPAAAEPAKTDETGETTDEDEFNRPWTAE
jgi:hypothetical protein